MKLSQGFVGTGIGAIGLLAGGLLASMFVLGGHGQQNGGDHKPEARRHRQLFGGQDDLPTLARGGSSEFFSSKQWTPVNGATTISNYAWAYQTTGVDDIDVSMDGVKPCPNHGHLPCNYASIQDPETVDATVSANWIIELSYRDNSNRMMRITTYDLQLCTSFPMLRYRLVFCPSNPLYLVDKSKKGMFHPKSVNEMFDTFYRLAYDFPQCAGTADSTDPHCDHIKKIKVSGLSFQNANQVVVNDPFTCRGGACEIGFGKQ